MSLNCPLKHVLYYIFFKFRICTLYINCTSEAQAPVVQTLDSAIHRMNLYSIDKY